MKQDEILRYLNQIAEFEDQYDVKTEFKIGWCHREVRIPGVILASLHMAGYLENVFRSNSRTGYWLNEKGQQAVAASRISDTPAPAELSPDSELSRPEDMFQDIIGHDELKELLRACLLAERPVHVLLTGPPALAKSIFLWDIERAYGEKALWILGSGTSKGGLWDVIAKEQPQVLLIDEIDKVEAIDQAALLSVMEGGRVVRTKVGRELDLVDPLRVVAASNRVEKLSPELRSRFAIRRLNPYSREEFLTVVQGVLVSRENTSPEVAEEIARGLDGYTQSMRDAIKVARLVPQLGVVKAIKYILDQPGG